MNQPPQYPPPYSSDPPHNSSPVRSETDPVELLGQFFDWLADQSGFSSEQQRAILEPIREKLIEDQRTIDTLKTRRPNEGMTNDIREAYGFKIGALARIRSKISDFKRSRV